MSKGDFADWITKRVKGFAVQAVIDAAKVQNWVETKISTGGNGLADASIAAGLKNWMQGELNSIDPVKITALPAAVVGYGLPDLDIGFLGIGNHRYFLFHSAIGLHFLKKFYLFMVYDMNKIESPELKKFLALSGAFMSYGVALHLLIDCFQPKAVIFPFVGSLIDGTILDDNLWLLTNACWATKIGSEFWQAAKAD